MVARKACRGCGHVYSNQGTTPLEVGFDAPANAWREVRLPLERLDTIQAFEIVSPAGAQFYADDIRLLRARQP